MNTEDELRKLFGEARTALFRFEEALGKSGTEDRIRIYRIRIALGEAENVRRFNIEHTVPGCTCDEINAESGEDIKCIRLTHPDAVFTGEGSIAGNHQGFTDDDGNFYDRKQALKYAIKCGQIKNENSVIAPPWLFSEDRW